MNIYSIVSDSIKVVNIYLKYTLLEHILHIIVKIYQSKI